MFKFIQFIFTLAIFTTLVSCEHIYGDNGMIKNRDSDYLKAQSIPPLKLPPGTTSNIHPNYPIPAKQYPGSDMQFSATPPELNNPSN